VKNKNQQKENENNKLKVRDLHHVTCFDLQTAVPTATGDISNCSYKANTLHTVTFRWKHWVMFTVICGMG